jgi:hypothetical protein
MAEGGEEKAIFVALRKDTQQALPKAAEHTGQFAAETADGAEKGLDAHATNELNVTDDINKSGEHPPESLPTPTTTTAPTAPASPGQTTTILQNLSSEDRAAAQIKPQEIKRLEAGKASKSIKQIRGMKDPKARWQAAEDNARQRYGGGPERPYPVPANADPDFPITKATTRKVDCPVDLPDGRTLAVEVKMYQQYRRVEVAPGEFTNQKVEVPLSNDIKLQINKDVALRNADSGYDPRWEFQGAGPSQDLRDYLTKAGIIFIEHH